MKADEGWGRFGVSSPASFFNQNKKGHYGSVTTTTTAPREFDFALRRQPGNTPAGVGCSDTIGDTNVGTNPALTSDRASRAGAPRQSSARRQSGSQLNTRRTSVFRVNGNPEWRRSSRLRLGVGIAQQS